MEIHLTSNVSRYSKLDLVCEPYGIQFRCHLLDLNFDSALVLPTPTHLKQASVIIILV